MSCEKIYQHIDLKISDQEFKEHLASCEYCREMNSKINQTLSLLDIESKVSENMTDRILSAKKAGSKLFNRKVDFSLVLQIAAVVIAGIFLGIVLGRNSNTSLLMSKHSKKQKSLIEYREIHHLNVNQELFN
jgi:predicted anti-sigma-YlaC factor YlaD